MMHMAGLLAQATTSAPDDLGGWLAIVNIGVAGLGLLAFVRGWIVPGNVYDQSIERERLKDERTEEIQKMIQDYLIPELTKANEIQIQMINLTNQFIAFIEEQKRQQRHEHD